MGEQAGDEVGLGKTAGLRLREMMHRARVWCGAVVREDGGTVGSAWVLRPCGGTVEIGDGLGKGDEVCAMEKWGCYAWGLGTLGGARDGGVDGEEGVAVGDLW